MEEERIHGDHAGVGGDRASEHGGGYCSIRYHVSLASWVIDTIRNDKTKLTSR